MPLTPIISIHELISGSGVLAACYNMASGSVLLAGLIAVRGDGLFRGWTYTVRVIYNIWMDAMSAAHYACLP